MANPIPREWTVLEERVVPDMPEDVYHADPVPSGSLSQSGAKLLLPPNTPRHFAYHRENPKDSTRAQRLGTAAHGRVLGIGAPITVLPKEFKDYNKKAAQALRDAAILAGRVPLLVKENDKIEAMAAALRADPYAAALLDRDRGRPEVSIFWIDPETGVWCRMRTDWLPEPNDAGEVVVVDYKTIGRQAHASLFSKQIFDFGYYIQNVWYRAGIAAHPHLSPHKPPSFVWIVQETEAPFAVQIFELDPEDEVWGEKQMRRALRTYAKCDQTGDWPGHPQGIQRAGLPRYALWQLRDAERDGAFYDPDYDGTTQTPGGLLPVYDNTYREWDFLT